MSSSEKPPAMAAQPGIAVDRFAREIVRFLKASSGALAATECQSVGPQPRFAFALPVACSTNPIRLCPTSWMLYESDSLLPLIRWMGESDS